MSTNGTASPKDDFGARDHKPSDDGGEPVVIEENGERFVLKLKDPTRP